MSAVAGLALWGLVAVAGLLIWLQEQREKQDTFARWDRDEMVHAAQQAREAAHFEAWESEVASRAHGGGS